MQSDRTVSANGPPVSPPHGSGPRTKLESLQAKCRRQSVVIDTLSETVSTFHRGAAALKAENIELRAELVGLRDTRRSAAGAAGRLVDGELAEVVVSLDERAPGAARNFVVQCLERRVVASALDSAQLVVSELVSNSLQHGGASIDEVVVSVELMPAWFRVGVHDSGSHAVIAAQPPDLETGGGFGLNLVQMLSERWGVERLAEGGTLVWAQLPRARGVSAGGPDGHGSGRLASRAA
jgi:anti-sigma regulatory factor (Ser/Thr protein kinase)